MISGTKAGEAWKCILDDQVKKSGPTKELPKTTTTVIYPIVHKEKYKVGARFLIQKSINMGYINAPFANLLNKWSTSKENEPIEVRMCLCILKFWLRCDYYWKNPVLITAALSVEKGELVFDKSQCMLVCFDDGCLQGKFVDVDVLYRKFRFKGSKIKKKQFNLINTVLLGIFSSLRFAISSSFTSVFQILVKNCRDSLNHLENFVSVGRKYSHFMQLIAFLFYCCDENIARKVASQLNMDNLDDIVFKRRQYLAVPDWMYRGTFTNYDSIRLDVPHDNIVYFLEWNDSECKWLSDLVAVQYCEDEVDMVSKFAAKPIVYETNLLAK